LENVVEIRVDAFKMCWLTRRPHIELAEDVGAWGYLMQVMMLLGVLSNTALIVWTSGSLGTHSSETKWFIFLAAGARCLTRCFLTVLTKKLCFCRARCFVHEVLSANQHRRLP
jgi:hypothetical protein